MPKLECQMTKGCAGEVTHIDNKGYVYCEPCGIGRRRVRPCRKMRKWEIRRLEQGQCISWVPKARTTAG